MDRSLNRAERSGESREELRLRYFSYIKGPVATAQVLSLIALLKGQSVSDCCVAGCVSSVSVVNEGGWLGYPSHSVRWSERQTVFFYPGFFGVQFQ